MSRYNGGKRVNEFEQRQYAMHVLNGEDHEAQYALANAFFEGEAFQKNDALALQLYERAAQLGHADATNNAADMYLNGEGTDVQYDKALMLFEQAAARGVAEAYFTLGMMYETALGVAYDPDKALAYYEQAATLHDVEAIYYIGMVYYEGRLNVSINETRAKAAFLEAAKYEHIDALFNCGYFFEYGIGGVVDHVQALYYYKRAAYLGDDEAAKRVLKYEV